MRVCAFMCFLPSFFAVLLSLDDINNGHARWRILLFPIACATPSIALLALVPAIRRLHLWAFYAAGAVALVAVALMILLSGLCVKVICFVSLSGMIAMIASLLPDLRTWHRQERLMQPRGFD